jgi:hypothetical protein
MSKEQYLKTLEKEIQEAQKAALQTETEQQEISQPQVDSEAGAGVAPQQVPPTEDTGEIERLKAEIESLKKAKQSGGDAAIEDDEVDALPNERLEKYREAFGDEVADLLAEDLVASKAKTKELESKLKQSERYKEYVGLIPKDAMDTFHSAEFQSFAKSKKLGRTLTLAEELDQINTTNDVDGAAYLVAEVQAWKETQKVTRKASGSASQPVQRFETKTQVVTEATLDKLLNKMLRFKRGTPEFDAASKEFDAASKLMKENHDT